LFDKKKLGLIGAAVAATFLLSSCSSPKGTQGTAGNGTEIGKTFKIGSNLELSGAVAAYGNSEKQGLDLAVEEINKAGGINGKQIEVISKDNKSDNAEAATVASNLTVNDKINALVGPATSGAAKAVIPNITKAQVPFLTPSGTDDSITVQNGKVQPYVFRSCFQDSYQGTVLANYADENLKAKKVVLFYDNSSDYAKGIAKAFKKAYKGEIVNEQTFVSGDKDFQAQLTKIKSKDFDAIIMPGYYTETGLITKQTRDMGITQPILGGDGFSDPKYIETAGNSGATDVYYVGHYSEKAPATDKVDAFVKAFNEKYGSNPSTFAALAYDAVYMIKQAAEDTKAKTSVDVTKGLASLKNFVGVTGKITIDKDHDPVKSAVVIGLKDGKEISAEAIAPAE
jgi:branched-chain amino acid transport system substrate-binding protein